MVTFGNVLFFVYSYVSDSSQIFKQVLGESSKTDMFMKNLIGILKRSAGDSQRRRLSLIRQDYLPHYDGESTPFQFFKTVEFNTIAVAFASFSEELARVHNRFNVVFENSNRPLLSVESNAASESYASALTLAHKSYVVFEREAREPHFDPSFTHITHSCHLHYS